MTGTSGETGIRGAFNIHVTIAVERVIAQREETVQHTAKNADTAGE